MKDGCLLSPVLFASTWLLAACFDVGPAPGSATKDAPPIFVPYVSDGGDSGIRDAGIDAGVDAGVADAGPSDAGTPGIKILSSNNRLPLLWTVTNAALLNRAPDAGTAEALLHVGQLVRLAEPTTSSNTVIDDDHCPNIFMGSCSGFAAADGLGNLVLVDAFALLGSGSADCASTNNATMLSSITGIWQGKLNFALMTTSYSLALNSCAGVGVGPVYTGNTLAPASTDIQELQANYPSDKRLVSVRGLVVGVTLNQTKLRTLFIEDPGGGPLSGIQLFEVSGLMPVPAIGDYVVVTASADTRGAYNQLLLP